MKYQIILRLLGTLVLLEGGAMLACAALGPLIWGESDGALFIGAAICIIFGLVMAYVLGKKPDNLPKREGLILVGISWIFFGIFGAVPYILGGPQLGVADAIFESVSGFTTTGATAIADLSKWPKDILLWRALSQWLGGLGILVLFMILLGSLGAGSKFLFKNESSFNASEFKAVKIRDVAMMILKLYATMTLICMLGLMAFGMDWYEAVTHAFTTISTAGFSIYNESIGYFSNWETSWMIETWLTLFMMLSSLSFIFYLILLDGGFKQPHKEWKDKIKKAEEIGVYLLILLFGLVFILMAEYQYLEGGEYLAWIRRSLFMVVSLSTTTGYCVIPERDWPVYDIPILSILMIIGGCAGSTAGGMKVNRMMLLLQATRQAW